MTVPRNTAFTWVTWIAKLMVGESACTWACWFRSHFEGNVPVDSDFDSAGWNVKHTRLLRELADRLFAEGCEVLIEHQNSFRVPSSVTGSVIAGKPDIIALDSEGRATIYDVKTGRRRDSHDAQVKLYMYLLPRVRGSRWYGTAFDGCLVYGDGSEKHIPASAVDDDFIGALMSLMRTIVSDEPARRVPSAQECRFCEISSTDCPERVEDEVA